MKIRRFCAPRADGFSMVQPVMKHRGIDFDVEENPPSFWHWKIYSEAGPMVIGDMKFQTWGAVVDACIVEINLGLNKGERGDGLE